MVSVIIPLYNVENYIKDCLASFEDQKYKNFELVIVDDGSTDCSAGVVMEYIKKSYMQIKLITQENAGVSVARNKGIKNAQGKYICFVDSDDMVTPRYLDKMINSINQKKCDMAICCAEHMTEDGRYRLHSDIVYHTEEMWPNEALEKFLFRDISPGVWSLMIKRDIILNNNLSFAIDSKYSEDIDFIFKLMANSKKIAYMQDKLYLYRIRNTSVMSLVDDKRLDGFKLMKNLDGYFDQKYPEFAKKFTKYCVSRWVWATLWQSAMAAKSYNEFVINCKSYNAKFYLKKLVTFPKVKVAISSLVFCMSPYLYYQVVLKFGKKRLKNRTLNNSKNMI